MRIRVHLEGSRHTGIAVFQDQIAGGGIPHTRPLFRPAACISSQSKASGVGVDLGTFRRSHPGALIRSISARRIGPPNKAPEPTSSSVMPRAIVPSSELKQRTEFLNRARAMPAEAVAHL